MRIIPSIGVFTLFSPIVFFFNSYRALFVIINGLLCHINEHSVKIKFYDIIFNIGILLYTIIFSPYFIPITPRIIIVHAIIPSIIFIINVMSYQSKIYSWHTSEIIHVIGVQGLLAYALFSDCLFNYKI